MLYDLDAIVGKSLMEVMRIQLPVSDVMPDEYQYNDNDVRFVYSDLGISAKQLEKLLKLTVRKDGIDRKLAYVTVWVEETGEAEFDPTYDQDMPVTIKHTVAVFE